MISIIIPHYNELDGIARLLKTIPLNSDIECILVDDYSDNYNQLLTLVNGYSLTNVKCFKNNQKKGAGTCRNIGIENSNGDWLLFADSDDYFTHNAFDIINKLLSESDFYDVLYFKPESINIDSCELSSRHINYENLVKQHYYNKDEKIRYSFFVPWSKLIKKQLILTENIRFDEVIASNDMIFSLKVGHYAKKIKSSLNVIYIVVERKGSLTRVKNEERSTCRIDVAFRFNHFLKMHQYSKYQLSLASLLRSYGRDVSLMKVMKIICVFIRQGWKIFPDSFRK